MKPEKFIDTIGQHLLNAIKDGTALKNPLKLTLFLVLSYADLKKYRFHYWAAYPTPFNIPEMTHRCSPRLLASKFSTDAIEKLKIDFHNLDSKSKCFFSIYSSASENLELRSLSEGVEFVKANPENSGKIYFAFFDSCDSTEPGWPLRNLLCLLYWWCPDYSFENIIKIVSYRGDDSVIYEIQAKAGLDREAVKKEIFLGRLVGWEANASGKMGPNIADLSQSMDPTKMAERAVDLNLKLMKWRLVPDLNLDAISKLKCLLLGAGDRKSVV